MLQLEQLPYPPLISRTFLTLPADTLANCIGDGKDTELKRRPVTLYRLERWPLPMKLSPPRSPV
ncbi:hypothetical protein O9993_02900 [Vibrio lentus]|nr:hypothetical protein [Vibrio lentus]